VCEDAAVISEPLALLPRVVADAEAALTRAWGVAAELLPLDPAQAVRPRSTVARCLLRADRADAPVSVIVKSTRGAHSDYNAEDGGPHSAAGRLLTDWAGCQFLADLSPSEPLAPRVFAADRETGVLVIEDLGDGASLSSFLQTGSFDTAAQALEAYAAGLGRLHASTAGRAAEFVALRSSLGLQSEADDPFVQMWPARNLPKLPSLCRDLDIDWTEAASVELEAVVAAIAEPGELNALSQGDTCPDNHRLLEGGVRFLDFEFAGFRHALLDLAFIWLPFPTCQDVQRLPRDLADGATKAYRAEFQIEDVTFNRALLHARAWWTMLSLGAYLPQALQADKRVGTGTLRQRLLLWLQNFADAGPDELPVLRTLTLRLSETLRDRWGADAESLFFPAFRT